MSQHTLQQTPVRNGRDRQVGFARLVAFEVRKLVDTRSSLAIFAVLAVIAVALVVGLAVVGSGQGTPVTFASLAGSIGLFTALAMPLIGILGMTSDTAYRTTLVYYPLLRGRTAQFWAKVLAAAVLALALQVFVFLLSAVVAAALAGAGPGAAGAFDGVGQELATGLASCLLSTMFGVALAAAIRRTALAIVAVILVSLVGNGLILTLLPDASGYLSTITALGALIGGPDTPTALEVASSLTLWYLIPLGIGWWITEKSEA
ncbi:hypothetical protein AU252_12095 [Pseudarthrobacter sulfonivorans]|uniref:Uncharacterized protein n=1 Tax=Pseudarthrobacter sulfonivorans TaxID=121292 RepID=A0A0U3QY73_9MICC|nr:ABC transporter permease [Pseudarthrobacter sulfonivorans]ALV41804.1 hypothetical protein AU252_12095 [Pseudarthrobacter sulfonivorans]